MSISFEIIVAAAANLLGTVMTLPQAIRLVRTRRLAGVSATWAALSVTVNAWWLVYATGVGDPAIVPVSAVSVAGYLTILVAMRRFGGGNLPTSGVAPLSATVLLPLAALAIGGWEAAGMTLGVLYGVQLAPAVLGAFRSSDLAGVSPGTWLLALLEAALWGVYGSAADDLGLVVLAVVGAVMSALVLGRLAWAAPAATPTPQPVGP